MSLKRRVERLEDRRRPRRAPSRLKAYWPDGMGISPCPIGKDEHGQYFDKATGERVTNVFELAWDDGHGDETN